MRSLFRFARVAALAFAVAAASPVLAAGKGATLSNSLLQGTFRTASYAVAPSNAYVGLLSICPTAGNTGTEVVGGGYTRSAAIAKGDASWNYTAATFIGASTITNAAQINFPTASASWTVNCFGVYDAASAGNLLYWGPVTGAPVTVASGASSYFAVGALTITEQ